MLNEPNIQKEITFLLCHDMIGRGASREVYENRFDPTTVVKVENGHNSFHNILEWTIWNAVKDTRISQWFAPCDWISSNGSVLIMKKTTPAVKYPTKIPSFFSDIKKENWGQLGDRVVCHDYGHNNIIEYGVVTSLKKAEW